MGVGGVMSLFWFDVPVGPRVAEGLGEGVGWHVKLFLVVWNCRPGGGGGLVEGVGWRNKMVSAWCRGSAGGRLKTAGGAG